VLPEQGGDGLGHVEPVRAEPEPGGVADAAFGRITDLPRTPILA
jgi:hypothetical protein